MISMYDIARLAGYSEESIKQAQEAEEKEE